MSQASASRRRDQARGLSGREVFRSLPQRAMEWEGLIRIYESRLWRRNPLFGLILGIPFERESAAILSALEITGHARILDLACGPGIFSRPIALRLREGRCVGLDLSLPMLRHARRRAAGETRPHFVRGDALCLPFAAKSFDAALCCGALHLFPDTARALGEVRRVLKPGGRFAVSTVYHSGLPTNALITRALLSLGGVQAYAPEELGGILHEAGFTKVRNLHARGLWMLMSAEVS